MKQTVFEGFFSERRRRKKDQLNSETISKAEAKLEHKALTGGEYLRYPLSHYLWVERRPGCIRKQKNGPENPPSPFLLVAKHIYLEILHFRMSAFLQQYKCA